MGEMADWIIEQGEWERALYGLQEPSYGVDIGQFECIGESKKAILVQPVKGSGWDEYWIPKSQIMPGSTVQEPGDVGGLEVSYWYAERFEDG